eukprot:gene1191-4406_t
MSYRFGSSGSNAFTKPYNSKFTLFMPVYTPQHPKPKTVIREKPRSFIFEAIYDRTEQKDRCPPRDSEASQPKKREKLGQ